MNTLAMYLEIAADNCMHNGDADIAVLIRHANAHIAALEAQLTESREREGRMREILLAVEPTEFDGDRCNDVNGANWYDARYEALAADQEKNDE